MKLSGNVTGKFRNFEDRLDTAMENIKQVFGFSRNAVKEFLYLTSNKFFAPVNFD